MLVDLDSPGKIFTHWILYNIPPNTKIVEENQVPLGCKQGLNDFGKIGYGAPCPPMNTEHRYFFDLYALDCTLDYPEGAVRDNISRAIDGHIVASANTVLYYGSIIGEPQSASQPTTAGQPQPAPIIAPFPTSVPIPPEPVQTPAPAATPNQAIDIDNAEPSVQYTPTTASRSPEHVAPVPQSSTMPTPFQPQEIEMVPPTPSQNEVTTNQQDEDGTLYIQRTPAEQDSSQKNNNQDEQSIQLTPIKPHQDQKPPGTIYYPNQQ
jgi:Raf kinase inhibitor-like YbhB/YbcL family protein